MEPWTKTQRKAAGRALRTLEPGLRLLDLCEETDHLVWPTTDLRCVPGSILHDVKVNPESDKACPPWEIDTEDLFLQTLSAYLRARRRATPMSARATPSSSSWASATS